MGRFATQFAGRNISFRLPFSMSGELNVAASASGITFPDATFLHTVDKPFEIHRVLVRLTGFDGSGNIEPQPTTLTKRVRLRFSDVSKNEYLTKAPTLVATMLKDNEMSWEWEEPYTIVRSEGFQVMVDTQAYPVACVQPAAGNPCTTGTVTQMVTCRVEIDFQGFLIVVAPPSETR